jgi:hypothetical protein
MRPKWALLTVLAGVLTLAGCRSGVQNDNLVHALYYSPVWQGVVKFNDATDVHALADTRFAHDWTVAMDALGADGYYALHRWLNQPTED